MTVPDSTNRNEVDNELATCRMALSICWSMGGVFLLLGIISEVTKMTFGLASTSWFLLVIGALLAGIIFKLGWVVAWYMKTTR